MIDDVGPMCRVCGAGGVVRYATFSLNNTETTNWYLCDYHAGYRGKREPTYLKGLKQLPNAPEIRARGKA